MTGIKTCESKIRRTPGSTVFGIIALALLILALLYSKSLKEWALSGLRLAGLSVIPSVFPFMIMSDILVSLGIPGQSFFGRIIKKVLGLSPRLALAALCGNICGFPIGVKIAAEEYRLGAISKEELEGALGVLNNPSLAFVISVVGLGIWGSIKAGAMLYLSVVIATLIVGYLFKSRDKKCEFSGYNIRQSFSLSESIKASGFASIGIASYMTFFSALTGLASGIIKNRTITVLFATLSEVGLATSLLSCGVFSERVSFALTALALGFSGMSVHMQAKMLLPKEISMRKYYLMKALEGGLAFGISFIFFLLF